MNTAAHQTLTERKQKAGIRRWIAKNLIFVVLLSVVLFGAAGRLDWLFGWGHLALMAVLLVTNGLVLSSRTPDLLVERSQMKEGTKSWDKVMAPLVALFGPLAIAFSAGLELRTANPFPFPSWLVATGYLTALAGSLFTTWAMASNHFFGGTVRIQTERGQYVVQSGPYQVVRHPGYLGGIVYNAAVFLTLGSLWALLPAGLTMIALVIRTALEDHTLQLELPGYRVYARQVRYRLVPGVW